MDTTLPQKFPFILDRNLAKANCTGNRVCTSCDIVALGRNTSYIEDNEKHSEKYFYLKRIKLIRNKARIINPKIAPNILPRNYYI